MAFDDVLARDPKSEEEFWAIIEETFEQVEGALTAYPAETREEALAGTLRDGNFKDASLSFIRYRGVREDLDSRDYFLELGRRVLPEVAPQIKARKLTPKFAKDWGVVMMCHGFISAHILDDSDGLDRVRAGQSGNRNAQRKYVAHQMYPLNRSRAIERGDAEAVARANKLRPCSRIAKFPTGFDEVGSPRCMNHGATRINLSIKNTFQSEAMRAAGPGSPRRHSAHRFPMKQLMGVSYVDDFCFLA